MVDWEAIEDRTRSMKQESHWSGPEDILDACAKSFQFDKWERQPNRVEVWIEKEALAGVLESCCPDLDVPYFACRGYVSQSEMWRAANRMKRYETYYGAEKVYILYFGDHDPSGMDMSDDVSRRMEVFGADVVVERLALNMDQIEQYSPPPNPAKVSDARAKAYIAQFGDESWELDALEPSVLVGLVRTRVLQLRDQYLWDERVEQEQQERANLGLLASQYSKAVAAAKKAANGRKGRKR